MAWIRLVLLLIALSACGDAAVTEPDPTQDTEPPVSELRIRLKPLVPCANGGVGERVVIDATERLERISSPPDLRYRLSLSDVNAAGDFTRTSYVAERMSAPPDSLAGGRSRTVLSLSAVDHAFLCTLSVSWRVNVNDSLEVLARETSVACVPGS